MEKPGLSTGCDWIAMVESAMEKCNKTSDEKAPAFTPRTPLAKRLWELRQEVLASGMPLLSLEEIRQELQARRGGVLDEEKA